MKIYPLFGEVAEVERSQGELSAAGPRLDHLLLELLRFLGWLQRAVQWSRSCTGDLICDRHGCIKFLAVCDGV